jgi:hypothetical protein
VSRNDIADSHLERASVELALNRDGLPHAVRHLLRLLLPPKMPLLWRKPKSLSDFILHDCALI